MALICSKVLSKLESAKSNRDNLNQQIEDFLVLKNDPESSIKAKSAQILRLYNSRKSLSDQIKEILSLFHLEELWVESILDYEERELSPSVISLLLDNLLDANELGIPLTNKELTFAYKFLNQGLKNENFKTEADYETLLKEFLENFNKENAEEAIEILKKLHKFLKSRDIKADLSKMSGYPESEIALTVAEAISGKFKYYCGDLELSELREAVNQKLPEKVDGDLILNEVISVEKLELPKVITGYLSINKIKTLKGVVMPQSVGGAVYAYNVETDDGLTLPESVGGTVSLDSLEVGDFERVVANHPNLKFNNPLRP